MPHPSQVSYFFLNYTKAGVHSTVRYVLANPAHLAPNFSYCSSLIPLIISVVTLTVTDLQVNPL